MNTKQDVSVFIKALQSTLADDFASFAGSAAQNFAVDRQLERFSKKFKVDNPALGKDALANFWQMNKLAGLVNVTLPDDIISDAREFIEQGLWRYTAQMNSEFMKSFIKRPYSSINLKDYRIDEVRSCTDRQIDLDVGVLLRGWRYGPGASIGTYPATHFADKIRLTKPTVTREAFHLFKILRRKTPHLDTFDSAIDGKKHRYVKGSTLTTVPKNDKIDRVIATEPLGNMALQLAMATYLEGALRSLGLDITTQESKNKTLAFKASVDDSLATIDLKSASDLITIDLIKKLWPTSWFSLMMMTRSSVAKEPNGQFQHLNMMSTMGCGFTFPMMTLTLLSLIYAVSTKHGVEKRFYIDYNTVGVYGDDMIVPSFMYEDVAETLGQAGLIVNTDKSFSSGPFRESCGGDYYMGYNVTPFYIKSLNCDSDIYVAINQLLLWQRKHKIPCAKTFEYLVSLLKEDKPFLIPEWEDSSYGIRTLSCPRRYKTLRKVPFKRTFPSKHPLASLVIAGGFVSSERGSLIYSPRSVEGLTKTRFEVISARIPKGFLDGYWPLLGPVTEAAWSDRFVEIALS